MPVRRIPDPTLEKGTTIVDSEGSQPSATSVDRTVYNADGSVLYDETWNTSYRGEYREIRVGTKPKPKPKPKPPAEKTGEKEKPPPAEESPPGTTTAPAETEPRRLRLSPSDGVHEGLRQPRRPPRLGVDDRVRRGGRRRRARRARSSAYS